MLYSFYAIFDIMTTVLILYIARNYEVNEVLFYEHLHLSS